MGSMRKRFNGERAPGFTRTMVRPKLVLLRDPLLRVALAEDAQELGEAVEEGVAA